ncbi:hypothetical protein JCM30237_05740 [Halolamina litorea]|uniref:Energy-coupling factor transport system substrate-specific component n=1 Tax=Halolamina litorea TaxID=1515593 RepID=A0ABD6BQL3_9EURY|nr:hypothetical protein [Halolamina litorea]
MVPSTRDVLFGDRFQRNLGVLTAAALFLGTFVAYATDVFAVSGGIVVIPGEATLAGAVVASLIGYERGALLPAWLSLFGAYLGFSAEWAFLGLSPSHSLAGRLAFLFDPVGLAVYAVASVLLGSAAFGAGYLLGLVADRVRGTLEEV